MPLFAKTAQPFSAHINQQPIRLQAGETLLLAALRQGIEFPNSCRVGGCGTCKCRLASGRVKELTETGYLLTQAEIAQGYILACQSLAESDVRIEVDLDDGPPARTSRGRIVAQQRLTHDIVRLGVQLPEALPYRAGQHARLTLDDLPGRARNYSFASPSQTDGRLEFFVRHVPGGAFSGHVHENDLLGQAIDIDGPHGGFWLRDSEAPLLLVAGGSGLAPILALLQDALARGVQRPATVLFGARTQRDLYALDAIEAIAEQWRGDFRFIPVLSDCDQPDWHGQRGLVGAHIPEVLLPGAHAYLCGPPAMVDHATQILQQQGVASQHIHADRFLAGPQTALPKTEAAMPPPEPARVLDYLKFLLFHAVGLMSAVALMAGGGYITAALALVFGIFILGDAIAGDDTRTPHYRHPGILTAQLWLSLPLLACLAFAAVWSASAGDPLGVGAWLSALTGYDLLAARDATTFWQHAAGVFLAGLMIGVVGTVPAHELVHRTWDRVSMAIGRMLLAFSFDTVFSIEHVYGHHRYVSTRTDPATAPRGRNVYAHILLSTLHGNISAWKIECERLRRRALARFSWHNKVITGHALSLLLVLLAALHGGAPAALYFLACMLWGKATLEIVNYMEHYGIVRDPREPVQPRHSWNTNKRISSWGLFNLTRHSHHHAQGEVPYHKLQPYPQAPMMINGYLTTFMITLLPPLWHQLMVPKLLAWDREFANAAERALAAQANAGSGLRGLQRA